MRTVGVTSAASTLKAGSALRRLDVSDNNIRDAGLQALASALPASSLEELDASGNASGPSISALLAVMGFVDYPYCLQAAANCSSLKILKMNRIKLDPKAREQLDKLRAARYYYHHYCTILSLVP